jgi:hypothetical protein
MKRKPKKHKRLKVVAPPGYELVHRTLWMHCGWGVALDPSFEHVPDEEHKDILTLADGKGREVSLSAFQIRPTDGRPWKTDEILAGFASTELSGIRYEHRTGVVSSGALWMFGDSDTMPPCWLLSAFVLSETTPGKAAQVTICCTVEDDLPWALETWRSILHVPEKATPLGQP